MTWTGTILGNLVSMKNSRRIVRFGSRPGMVKSKDALAWEKSAKTQLAFLRARPLLEGPLEIQVTVYFRSRRSDLDIELLKDVLQGYVYANDAQIIRMEAEKLLDVSNPRCEVIVTQCEE